MDILASCLLAAGLLIGCAGPLGAQATSMPPGPTALAAVVTGEARPLAAWVDFCRREAAECVVDITQPATIRLTPRVWQTLVGVNHRVNTAIAGMVDQDRWAVADHWDVDLAASGDCEDYQLTKRRRLAELGLPRRAMRMAVVVDRQGEGHAVLMLRTDRGDLVLDNKTDSILPWSDTGYTYVKRESQDRVGWVRFERAEAPAPPRR